MPAKQPTPLTLPTDEQLFAAIDRAERHLRGDRGASFATIKQHLGLPRSGWSTLKMRPQLERLLAAGEIERFKLRGIVVWTITDKGQRRLAAARKVGRIELPEAPQHRAWRESRSQAAERIEDYREDIEQRLNAAIALLADTEANSEAWQQTARHLTYACERLASVIYCLRDWPEPDDARKDTNQPFSRKLRPAHDWERG